MSCMPCSCLRTLGPSTVVPRQPTANMTSSRIVTAVVSALLLAGVAFVALSPDDVSSGAEVTSSEQLVSVDSPTTKLALEDGDLIPGIGVRHPTC